MFNFKLVPLAIFLILGCVFVHAQEGEKGAYVADVDFKPQEVEDVYGELELASPVEEEVKEAPKARRGSPCRPAGSSTSAPVTSAPTSAPTQKATSAPSSAPTQKATSVPTSAPTQKATSRPSTAPTQKATSAPTAAPTQKAPSVGGSYTGGLCDVVPAPQQKVKLLVPLYVYPGAAWDQVVTSASKADVIAIINPNSGPAAAGPDSSYISYMTKLVNAKVEMVGYVYTSYGARAIADVKKDIDTYATKYQNIKGIFFDEASADAKDIAFYTQAYNYVISKGMTHSILNPGVAPAQGYTAISSSIVIFEEAGSTLSGISFPSWVTCAPTAAEKANYKYKFAGIAHSTASSGYASIISTMQNKGIGLVYVTDGAAGCCTYNALTTYMTNQAATVQTLNS